MTELLAAVRAIHFASLMVVFGGSGYLALLRWKKLCEPPGKSARVLFMAAASFALVSGLAWFCLAAGQMCGDWRGSADPAVLELTASATRFGHIFLVRLIGLIALWLMCAATDRAGIAAFLAGLLLAVLAPVSHSAAGGGEVAMIGTISDAVHLLAGGSWLGGLAVLVLLIRLNRTGPVALLEALRLFSLWGSFAVALLVTTGVIDTFAILPLSSMSLSNAYFDLLLVKVGLAVAMMGLAALNRWRFAPALPIERGKAVRQLAFSVGLELVLAFTVVGIVGYLGTMDYLGTMTMMPN